MAEWAEALAVKPIDLRLIPGIHKVKENSLVL